MNPKMDQQRAQPDTRRKNIIGQQPGANSWVRKLLLLIEKSDVIDDEKEPTKDYNDSNPNR